MLEATMYIRPNGDTMYALIGDVRDEDAAFFNENTIHISMEQIGADDDPEFVVYAELNIQDEDGENIELVEIANGRSCKETLKALREDCEDFINGKMIEGHDYD